MKLPPTARGASVRALKLRTVISRGGTATAKHIFGTSIRARKEVMDAIEAATTDDAPTALTKFATIVAQEQASGEVDLGSPPNRLASLSSPSTPPTRRPSRSPRMGTSFATRRSAQEATRPDSEQHADASGEPGQHARARREHRRPRPPPRPSRRSRRPTPRSRGARPRASPRRLPRRSPTTRRTSRTSRPRSSTRACRSIPSRWTRLRRTVACSSPLEPERASPRRSSAAWRTSWTTMGTSPSKIMAVTFNKKAALELQEKLQKKLGAEPRRSRSCATRCTPSSRSSSRATPSPASPRSARRKSSG